MSGVYGFEAVLGALAALAEATRLRLAVLLREGELTVSELTTILGQSQPRVSRHLRLLVDAGLIDRHREGAWAFFRLADTDFAADIVARVIETLDPAHAVIAADRARLTDVRAGRGKAADSYFARHAADWDRLRAMHVAEDEVEAAVRAIAGEISIRSLLDLGTGTGRMLSLLAPMAERAIGVDTSHAMLAVARANLEASGIRNAQLRQGDIYALPVERDGYDLVLIHQVLHYLDDPSRAVREAARVLRPGGRLIVVDFAPHEQESLRESHAHRRLGFARSEIEDMFAAAGLDAALHRDLAPSKGGKLTVSIWVGRDRRILDDRLSPAFTASPSREVA